MRSSCGGPLSSTRSPGWPPPRPRARDRVPCAHRARAPRPAARPGRGRHRPRGCRSVVAGRRDAVRLVPERLGPLLAGAAPPTPLRAVPRPGAASAADPGLVEEDRVGEPVVPVVAGADDDEREGGQPAHRPLDLTVLAGPAAGVDDEGPLFTAHEDAVEPDGGRADLPHRVTDAFDLDARHGRQRRRSSTTVSRAGRSASGTTCCRSSARSTTTGRPSTEATTCSGSRRIAGPAARPPLEEVAARVADDEHRAPGRQACRPAATAASHLSRGRWR